MTWGDAKTGAPVCHFALCERPAELSVAPNTDVAAVLVCGLHVTPVLSWGVVALADPVIEYLHARRTTPDGGIAA